MATEAGIARKFLFLCVVLKLLASSSNVSAQTITGVKVYNTPMSGGLTITVLGTTFGTSDTSPTVYLSSDGSAACSVAYVSKTSILCNTSPLSQSTSSKLLTVNAVDLNVQLGGAFPSSTQNLLTFDAPIITSNTDTNAPHSGGALVTLFGVNFGATDFSGTSRIGKSACASTIWVSNTQINCVAPDGDMADNTIAGTPGYWGQIVTVGAVVGTRIYGFTFDAPVISTVIAHNSAADQYGGTISVLGLNFGRTMSTPTAQIWENEDETLSKMTTSWTSYTLLRVQTQMNNAGINGNKLSIKVTVSAIVGTRQKAFSFDAPVASGFPGAWSNGSPSTGVSVTISGLNFGRMVLSPTAVLEDTFCLTTSWSSSTTISCSQGASPPGASSVFTKLTVATNVGTAAALFSFDAPVTSFSLNPSYNLPRSGLNSVTISGLNFGKANYSPTISVLSAGLCGTTAWSSATTLSCASPTGYYLNVPIKTTISQVVATLASSFSFDAPVVSYLANVNGPPQITGHSITLHGMSFTDQYFSPSIRLGITLCSAVSYHSLTSITCSPGSPDGGHGKPIAVTISAVIGTKIKAFTFDNPIITTHTAQNSPLSWYQTSLTLTGANFGIYDNTPTSAIFSKASVELCATTAWTTATNILCTVPASGGGKGKNIAVTVSAIVGTRVVGFTYDAPVTSFSPTVNLISTGSGTVTVFGLNFGGVLASPTATIADEQCATTSWTSTTTLLCGSVYNSGIVGPGTTSHYNVVLTVSAVVGTRTQMFSFSAPVVSSVGSRMNSVTSLGGSVTISGLNFGYMSNSPTLQLDDTMCLTTSWSSATTVSCTHAAGAGPVDAIKITVNNVVGTAFALFTFDAPVVSFSNLINQATNGEYYLTVNGLNFGGFNSTPSAGVGYTSCVTTTWTSVSSVWCSKSHYGLGAKRAAKVTVGGIVGTSARWFTFDSPVLTAFSPANVATRFYASVTLLGVNFGAEDATASLYMGVSACTTTAWTSGSTLKCFSLKNGLATPTAKVYVAAIVGTRGAIFTFDAAIPSFSSPVNSATTGSGTITLTGSNFGASNYTPTMQIDENLCETAAWTSTTTTLCYVPSGVGSAKRVVLTVAGFMGTKLSLFTYDAPVPTTLKADAYSSNGVASGGFSVTIAGLNFGTSHYSPTVRILDLADCLTTMWSSATTLQCNGDAGYGEQRSLALTISSLVGTMRKTFSFDAPTVSFLSGFGAGAATEQMANSPTTGGRILTINGLNFATEDLTPSAQIGTTGCLSTTWNTLTVLTCTVAPGASTVAPVLTLSLLVGSTTEFFTYDAPVVSGVASINGPAVGGSSLTVSGVNFAASDLTASVRLAANMCLTASWTAATSLLCQNNYENTGERAKFAVTLASVIGTSKYIFSFDGPQLTHVDSINSAHSGGTSVSVTGTNFGAVNLTPSVGLGDTSCGTVSWTTTTAVACYSNGGQALGLDVNLYQKFTGMKVLYNGLNIGTGLTTTSKPSDIGLRSGGNWAGHGSITISGLTFGTTSYTPTIAMQDHDASAACATTSWSSTTTVQCGRNKAVCDAVANGLAPGCFPRMIHAAVQASLPFGTRTTEFSYDTPVLSQSLPANAATTYGGTITLFGMNFGMMAPTPTIAIETTLCTTTSWSSNTVLACAGSGTTITGVGEKRFVALTLSSIVGTVQNIFTFDAGVVTMVQSYNGPTTGGASVTVNGMNFAAQDFTPSVLLGNTDCVTIEWKTSTSLLCQLASGSGAGLDAILTLNTLVGTQLAQFSYDSPVVSWDTSSNLPTSEGSVLTVRGTNFGYTDLTQTATLDGTACVSNAWISPTSVNCVIGKGSGTLASLILSVSAVVGTKPETFTYDSPVLSSLEATNSPMSALNSVTVIGTNFAQSDTTVSATIGSTMCGTTAWTTVSTVVCQLEKGYSRNHDVVLQISEKLGSNVAAFSYDAPVVSWGFVYNGPTTSQASITLSGSSFGYEDFTITMQLGGSVCLTTSWLSQTTVECTPPISGGSRQLHKAVTLASIIGTKPSSFTYDAPVLSRVLATNTPTCVGTSITLHGFNFGAQDPTGTVQVGSGSGTMCGSTSWVTASTIICQVTGIGTGKRKHIVLSLGGQTGCKTNAFSYDAPVVSHIMGNVNAPTTSGASVTMHGVNFGSIDFSPTARVGLSNCPTVGWTTGSSIACLSPGSAAFLSSGGVRQTHVSFDLQTLIGTLSESFTYDAPVLSRVDSPNGPATGSAVISIAGLNYAVYNSSPTAVLGTSICASSQWLSSTMVTCTSGVGSTVAQTTTLTVDSLVGTQSAKFTFDGPVITDTHLTDNAPSSGDSSVTVLGLNFATEDLTGSIRLGSSSCGTSAWTSNTALKCLSAGGTAGKHDIAVSIASLVGTQLQQFTFDAPVISSTIDNLPPTTAVSLTVSGANFGVSGQTMSARIGSTACGTTMFVSSTSLVCYMSSLGVGLGFSSSLTVVSLVSTRFAVYTYDAPALTTIYPRNHPSSDGSSITLMGTNFLMHDYTPTMLFGSTFCNTVSWTSTTSANCKSIEGTGFGLSTAITVDQLIGTELAGFSYDAPTVSYVMDDAGAPSGGFSVTLSGHNFGYTDFSASVKIGETLCTTTSWNSRTQLRCQGASGFGNNVPVSVIVDEVIGSQQDAFTYTGPIISYFSLQNSPPTGGASITLQGENFGIGDPTPTVIIGVVGASNTQRCLTSSWYTVTSVRCAATSDGGNTETVRLNVGENIGTGTNFFTYDAPILSRFEEANAPLSGDTSITIVGVNFGKYDFSLSSRVGETACGTTSWMASSSVLCLSDNYGSNKEILVSVTVEGIQGTAMGAFTYDAPVTSFMHSVNAAPSAAISVTLYGFNFAHFDLSPTTYLGTTTCGTTSWTTTTTVRCEVATGAQGAISVGVVNFGVHATSFALFSYDSPLVTHNSQYNGAGTGALTLTVSGANFGVLNLTPSVKIGKTTCRTTTWSSLTSLLCNVPAGYGSDRKVAASVGNLAGTKMVIFTYDAPIITMMSHRNMPTTSGASLTIYGTNFGFENTTPLPKVGSTRCATTSWNSETTLVCKSAGGVGTKLNFALTVGVLVGTHTNYFTYDAPVLTFPARPNAPTSGGASITIHGFNYVPSDGSLTAAVGVTQCYTTAWTSASALVCASVSGGGTPYTSLVDTAAVQLVGTGIQLFTYDAPILSALHQPNAGMSGTASITLIGANFAYDDLTPTVNIGSSTCITAQWTTSTFVTCRHKDGSAVRHTTVLTVGALASTSFRSFSYDSPTLTYINRFNMALTDGISMTINGFNFGLKDDYSPTIRFTSTYCATTSWVATTALICSGVTGEGIDQTLIMSMESQVGTGFQLFSYDAPVISIVERNNSPATAGTIVTLSGTHFGVSDLSSTATIGTTTCQTTAYTSMTSVACLVPQGAGSFLQASLTVANNAGTMASSYSYDAPIVTFVDKFNAPSTTGAQVTISGFNFGFEDFTPSVHLGRSTCATTTWTSLTATTCTVNTGHGDNLNVAISVNSVVGTRLLGFTYDSPVVSDNEMYNAPTTSGMSVTVTGLNFASIDFTVTAEIADVVCPTASWSTATSVTCLSPAYGGFDLPLEVVIEGHSGTGFNAFTFDAAVMTLVNLWNAATSGGISVTLSGNNFAASDLTNTVLLGDTSCATTSWNSVTTMLCLTSAGTGLTRSVKTIVHSLVGTQAISFSYDSPVISQTETANVASSGMGSVTVTGLNFGSMDNTVSTLLGATVCQTSSWTSGTTVMCLASPGSDKDLIVAEIVDANQGSTPDMFTYDAPVVTKQTLDNVPASGGTLITVSAVNFGISDTTPVVALGVTACSSSNWISDTSATCFVAPGTGKTLASLGAVHTNSLIGTYSRSFSFDAPVVSRAAHQNGPATSGASVTVEGIHFGLPDPSATVTLGLTSCATSSWVSNTGAACLHNFGSGANLIVGMTITANVGTGIGQFSFDSPALSRVHTANTPTTQGGVVTVSGLNLGFADLSQSVRLGATSCASTIWISATQVLCRPDAGTGNTLHMGVTLDGVVGTAAVAFSYDAPVVSQLLPENAPATGMTNVMLSGTNFGAANLINDGVFVRLGDTVCMSNYWISYTSLQCSHSFGVGSALLAQVDLTSQMGTVVAGFTYDSPAVTFLNRPNAPTTGRTSLTVRGTNFGPADYSATFSIGTSACGTTSWRTDTLVYCTVASGVRPALHVPANVGGVIGTFRTSFTYDSPLVTRVSAPNAPTLTGATITVEGTNFGTTDSSMTVNIGGSQCLASIWVTNSAVKCVHRSGSGSSQTTNVVVTTLSQDYPASFTFDAPIVTYVVTDLPNAPTSSTFSMTLTGFNFGVSNLSPEINFGGKVCETTSWNTVSSLLCQVGSGAGYNRASATVDNVIGTGFASFTYDSPIITLLSVMNSAASSGGSVTVSGVNFGTEDFTPSARIGDTGCATFSWTSSTASTCLAPPGAGIEQSALLTLSAIVGTGLQQFSFDTPALSFAQPTNNPATGGGVVTVLGRNFGVSDKSGMAGISPTSCDSTTWVSDTSVACSLASGTGRNSMTMSLVANVGTLYSSFTFDSPAVTRLHVPNAPTTSGATITLMGTNFGTSESSSTVAIASSSCLTTYWSSATQMVCSAQISLGLQKTVTLDVASIAGTFLLAFSYDSPIVTSTGPFNIPTSAGGSISITLQGTNFGSLGVNPTAYIGETACISTQWISTTTSTCNPGPGIGAQVDLNLLLERSTDSTGQVADYIGGVREGFTYDTPVITSVSIQNGPTSGGTTLTMVGTNFGMYDASAKQVGIVAGQPCNATKWISNTAISCEVPAAVGISQHVGLLVEKNIGTMPMVFTYDVPILSDASPANGPTLGGAQVTIHGLNLGAALGGESRHTWVSSYAGWGVRAFVSNDTCVKQDPNKPPCVPTFEACVKTTFLSANSVVCQTPPGSGAQRALKVVVSQPGNASVQEGVFTSSFSYDAPVLTHLVPSNAPPTGGATLTLYGMNFNASGLLLGDATSSDQTRTASYISDSAVSFRQPGVLKDLDAKDPSLPTDSTGLAKDIWAIVGTIDSNPAAPSQNKFETRFDSVFSYDAPVLQRVIPVNAPTNGGEIITIEGKNFGSGLFATTNLKASVGGQACQKQSWISRTSIECVSPPGLGLGKSVSVSVNKNVGRLRGGFTFDAPVITSLATPDIATSNRLGNYTMSISGFGFGLPQGTGVRRSGDPPTFSDSDVLVSIGDAYCFESKFISPTNVICRTIAAPSPDVAQRVSVTVGGNVDEYFARFQFGTICPSNCSAAQGQGECSTSSGLCQCKNVPNSERVYQGADCSLDYCLGQNLLTAAKGDVTDHTEIRYLYIPWYKPQVGSASCAWSIRPDAGQVTMVVSKMDMHPDDSLLVYDGKDSNGVLLANLTGTLTVPGTIYSTGGDLFVTMQTPLPAAVLRTGYTGFNAAYNSQPKGCPLGCSAHLGLGKCLGTGASASCQCLPGWRGAGCEIGYTALQDSFEPDSEDDMWLDRRGAVFSFGCGQQMLTTAPSTTPSPTRATAQAGNALFFHGSNNRYIVTNSLDLRHGGFVSFHIKVGTETGANATCELVDEGEEIVLQWTATLDKINTRAANWQTFGTYPASAYQNFRLVQVQIPPEAYGDSVYLRWIQPKHDRVKGKDTWALDSVQVVTPYKCEIGIDNKECSGRGTCFATNECQCFDGFVGGACEDACHWNYWHEKVCGCAAPIDPYSS